MFEQIIRHHAKIRPHALAITAPQGVLSFQELERDIVALRALLARAAPLDGLIGVAVENVVDHWITLFALARAGLATLSLPHGGGAFVAEQATYAGVEWVVSDRQLPLVAMKAVVLGRDWRSEACGLSPVADAEFASGDLVRVTVSSGSTGRPKLIGLTRGLLDTRIRNAPMLGPMAGGKLLSLIGLDNWGGFYSPLISWATSGSVMFLGDTINWPHVIAYERPELLIAAPLHLAAILHGLPTGFQPVSPFRIVVAGGAVPTSLSQAVRTRLSPDLFICYASTEVGFVSYGHVGAFPGKPGGAGYVLPWSEVEVLSEDGTALAPDQIGVLRTRGEEAVSGYYTEEVESGDIKDGWFYPGDLGSVSAAGLLVIAGRLGEVMNCAGVKISPLPIEDRLLRCPGVIDAAAVAVTRPGGFDEPYAAIVVGDGFQMPDAHSALADYEHEIRVVVVDTIPRTPGMGKIMRKDLREKIAKTIEYSPHLLGASACRFPIINPLGGSNP